MIIRKNTNFTYVHGSIIINMVVKSKDGRTARRITYSSKKEKDYV